MLLKDGKNKVLLAEYLNNYPLVLKTTDDSVIEGNEICSGAPDAIVFSSNNINNIAWEKYDTDIRCEFGQATPGQISIQDALDKILIEQDNFDYMLYDHGSGEIADYITIKETEHMIEVVLFHVKAMGGKNLTEI